MNGFLVPRKVERTCKVCGAPFAGQPGQALCGREACRKANMARHGAALRKKRKERR